MLSLLYSVVAKTETWILRTAFTKVLFQRPVPLNRKRRNLDTLINEELQANNSKGGTIDVIKDNIHQLTLRLSSLFGSVLAIPGSGKLQAE